MSAQQLSFLCLSLCFYDADLLISLLSFADEAVAIAVLLGERNEAGEPVLRWNLQWSPEKVRLTFPTSSSRMTKKEAIATKKGVLVPFVVALFSSLCCRHSCALCWRHRRHRRPFVQSSTSTAASRLTPRLFGS